MRRRAWATMALGGGALAGVLLGGVPMPARIAAALLLVPLPAAATLQLQLVGDPADLPRIPLYLSSLFSLWLLAAGTALMAWLSGFDATTLGLFVTSTPALFGWATLLTAAGLGLLGAARMLGIRESPLLRRLLPETTREKLVFVGLSVTAGICEEFVFRGFLLHVLEAASGSVVVAFVISAAVFGWMHAYQQPTGALRAGLLGALLTVPVVLSGSIVPSIIAHTAIDVAGGILLQRKLAPAMA